MTESGMDPLDLVTLACLDAAYLWFELEDDLG